MRLCSMTTVDASLLEGVFDRSEVQAQKRKLAVGMPLGPATEEHHRMDGDPVVGRGPYRGGGQPAFIDTVLTRPRF